MSAMRLLKSITICAMPLIVFSAADSYAAPTAAPEEVTTLYNATVGASSSLCTVTVTRRSNGAPHITAVNNRGVIQDKDIVTIMLPNPGSTLTELQQRRLGVQHCNGCTSVQVTYTSTLTAYCSRLDGCNPALLQAGETFNPENCHRISAGGCDISNLPAGCTYTSGAPACTKSCSGPGGSTPPGHTGPAVPDVDGPIVVTPDHVDHTTANHAEDADIVHPVEPDDASILNHVAPAEPE